MRTTGASILLAVLIFGSAGSIGAQQNKVLEAQLACVARSAPRLQDGPFGASPVGDRISLRLYRNPRPQTPEYYRENIFVGIGTGVLAVTSTAAQGSRSTSSGGTERYSVSPRPELAQIGQRLVSACRGIRTAFDEPRTLRAAESPVWGMTGTRYTHLNPGYVDIWTLEAKPGDVADFSALAGYGVAMEFLHAHADSKYHVLRSCRGFLRSCAGGDVQDNGARAGESAAVTFPQLDHPGVFMLLVTATIPNVPYELTMDLKVTQQAASTAAAATAPPRPPVPPAPSAPPTPRPPMGGVPRAVSSTATVNGCQKLEAAGIGRRIRGTIGNESCAPGDGRTFNMYELRLDQTEKLEISLLPDSDYMKAALTIMDANGKTVGGQTVRDGSALIARTTLAAGTYYFFVTVMGNWGGYTYSILLN